MKWNNKKNKFAAIMVLLGCLLAAGCSRDDASKSKNNTFSTVPQAHAAEKLTVGINTTIKSTPIILAGELGYFTENGLQVELAMVQAAAESVKSLFAGQVDIAAVPEHIAAFESIKRSDFQILAAINRNESNEIVARKDHGINSVQDLKGKKIGIKKKSSSIYWLNRLLLYNNLSLQDVQLIDAKPRALVEMVSQGSVDAVITWHPHAYKSRKALADKAFYIKAQMGQHMYWLLMSRKQWLADNPALVVKFLKALQQAIDFIIANPDKAKDIVAKYLNMESNYMDFEWPLHQFRLELPQSLILALEQECRWKISQTEGGYNLPNYLEFIYFDGLSGTAPGSISIFH
jgi:ABC-type nitrate/sulfonate/bicarbonate transport system substrate-binding protein